MYNITCENCFKSVDVENVFSNTYICNHCGHSSTIPDIEKRRIQKSKTRAILSIILFVVMLGTSIYWKIETEKSWEKLSQWQKFLKKNNKSYSDLAYAKAKDLNAKCLLKNQRKCLLLSYYRMYQLDSSDVKVKAEFAYQLVKFKFYNEGIQFLEEIVNESQATYDVYSFLGIAYYKTQFYKEAITAFHKALSVTPNLQGITLMLADSYLQLGKYKEAKKTIRKFVKKYPSAKPMFKFKLREIKSQQVSQN